MPFISRSGNLKIIDDYSTWKYNAEKKQNEYILKDFDAPLTLTNVGNYSFTKDTQDFIETIYDGDPDQKGMYFKGNVWFRVKTKDFDEIDYWRFYKKFRGQLIGEDQIRFKDVSQTIYYVPGYEDFQVNEYGKFKGFHYPLWFLDIIVNDGLPEKGLELTKDGEPGVHYVTPQEYLEMKEIYEYRKANEDLSLTDEIKKALEEHTGLLNKERNRLRMQGSAKSRAAKSFNKEISKQQVIAEKNLLEGINKDLTNKESIDEISELLEEDISTIKKDLAKAGLSKKKS